MPEARAVISLLLPNAELLRRRTAQPPDLSALARMCPFGASHFAREMRLVTCMLHPLNQIRISHIERSTIAGVPVDNLTEDEALETVDSLINRRGCHYMAV